MARSKQILFLGRTDKDTGYDYCVKLCRQNKWKLVVAGGLIKDPTSLIKKSDYVFVPGYLSILEAFKHKKPILFHYNNPLKRDYYQMHPMFNKNLNERYQWAKKQTWEKLASQYEQLWKK